MCVCVCVCVWAGGEGGQIGQILGPFMITCGLSCDHVGFGNWERGGKGQMTPLTTPPHPPGYGPVVTYIMCTRFDKHCSYICPAI